MFVIKIPVLGKVPVLGTFHLLGLFLPLFLTHSAAEREIEQHKRFERTLLVSTEIEAIQLNVFRGFVRVTASSDDSLRIGARLGSYDQFAQFDEFSDPEILSWQAFSEFEILTTESGLVVNNADVPDLIYYTVEVPSRLHLDVQVRHDGMIEVQGLDGSVSASTYNGRIQITDVSGAISAESSRSGDITIQQNELNDNPLIATSYSGSIDVTTRHSARNHVQVRSDLGKVTTNWASDEREVRTTEPFEIVEDGIRRTSTGMWIEFGASSAASEKSIFVYSVRGNVSLTGS